MRCVSSRQRPAAPRAEGGVGRRECKHARDHKRSQFGQECRHAADLSLKKKSDVAGRRCSPQAQYTENRAEALLPARIKPSHRNMTGQTQSIPLLVLDTNVVLDWVAFSDARVQPMVDAIESGSLRLATSGACLQELRRALGYAQVRLDAAAQALAFRRYAAHARVFEIPGPVAAIDWPSCADPDDQKFLELAWHARASHLITRDKALLKLARRVAQSGRFAVLAPDAFLRRRTQPQAAAPPG